MTQQIQPAEPTLQQLIQRLKPQIALALPKHISPDRIARIALTAIGNNPKLAACTPNSFLAALMQASQLGLEVNSPLGHAYLVPYKDVATLIVGYKGKLDLARRSGLVRAIFAYPVFEGDEFEYGYGMEPFIKHKPGDGEQDPLKLTHVYSVARLKEGDPVLNVLTRNQVDGYRRRSRAAGDGPWVTDYIPMALKTSIHRLSTWLPLSAEQARAQVIDMAAERDLPQLPAFDENIQAMFAEQQEPPKPALDRVVELKQAAGRSKAKPKEEPTFDPIDAPGVAPGQQIGGERTVAPQNRPHVDMQLPADDSEKLGAEPKNLHIVLGLIDPIWKGHLGTIQAWTDAQRVAAYRWASGPQGATPPACVERVYDLAMTKERTPGEEG